MNKKLSVSIFLVFQVCLTWGQSSIEGIFSIKGGASSFSFTRNHKYFYKSISCTGSTIDSGCYEFHGDTILFHSSLNHKDIESNFLINSNTWQRLANKTIDTLYLSIQNFAAQGLTYAIDILLNDSLLTHIDSLHHYDRKYYKFYLNRNANDGILKVVVNGKQIDVFLDTEIDIQIIENYNSIEPIKDCMFFEKDRMYSLRYLKVLNKKYYWDKQ